MYSNKIGYFKVSPGQVTAYSLPESYLQYGTIGRKKRKVILPANNQRKGYISHKSRKNLYRSFRWLNWTSKQKTVFNPYNNSKFKFKLNFITLTLSDKQKHTDDFIKRTLFKNWIDNLKYKYPGISYIWKAETQDNGNIHFHITTNHFLSLTYVNRTWNEQLKKHGYLDNYFKQNKTYNCNATTQVKAVKKETEICGYFAKYMAKSYTDEEVKEIETATIKAKNDWQNNLHSANNLFYFSRFKTLLKKYKETQRRKINGALWGCSENLHNPDFTLCEIDLDAHCIRKINNLEVNFQSEHCTIFRLHNLKKFITSLGKEVYTTFDKHKDWFINHNIPKDYFKQTFVIGLEYAY